MNINDMTISQIRNLLRAQKQAIDENLARLDLLEQSVDPIEEVKVKPEMESVDEEIPVSNIEISDIEMQGYAKAYEVFAGEHRIGYVARDTSNKWTVWAFDELVGDTIPIGSTRGRQKAIEMVVNYYRKNV